MRALVLRRIGGLGQLEIADIAVPELAAPDDVLVRVRTAGLNRLDLFVAAGLPGVELPLPHVPGADAAGVVEQVGGAVRSVAPGDRVMINPGLSCGECRVCRAGDQPLCPSFRLLGEHRAGTFAEFVVVPARNLAPMPPAMPWAEAGGFSLATLTAWRMLITRARLRPGETVVIWGAGGGVALAAVQVASLCGGMAIVTSSSEAKLETARRAGAAVTINQTGIDLVAEVRRATGGRGADVVIDCVGEATWPSSLRVLGRGGRLVVCGATTGPMVGIDARKLFWHQWNILGSTMGSDREYQEIVALAARGKLWPVIDEVVPLDRAPEAYRRLHQGTQAGKIVIEVST